MSIEIIIICIVLIATIIYFQRDRNNFLRIIKNIQLENDRNQIKLEKKIYNINEVLSFQHSFNIQLQKSNNNILKLKGEELNLRSDYLLLLFSKNVKTNLLLLRINLFRKIINTLLSELIDNNSDSLRKTANKFSDILKPNANNNKFFIIYCKEDNIENVANNKINIIIDFMMFIHNYTSEKIHLNKNQNIPEIFTTIKNEQNSENSDVKTDTSFNAYELIDYIFNEYDLEKDMKKLIDNTYKELREEDVKKSNIIEEEENEKNEIENNEGEDNIKGDENQNNNDNKGENEENKNENDNKKNNIKDNENQNNNDNHDEDNKEKNNINDNENQDEDEKDYEKEKNSKIKNKEKKVDVNVDNNNKEKNDNKEEEKINNSNKKKEDNNNVKEPVKKDNNIKEENINIDKKEDNINNNKKKVKKNNNDKKEENNNNKNEEQNIPEKNFENFINILNENFEESEIKLIKNIYDKSNYNNYSIKENIKILKAQKNDEITISNKINFYNENITNFRFENIEEYSIEKMYEIYKLNFDMKSIIYNGFSNKELSEHYRFNSSYNRLVDINVIKSYKLSELKDDLKKITKDNIINLLLEDKGKFGSTLKKEDII